MKIKHSLRMLCAAGAVTVTSLAAIGGGANALGSDIAGDRISWYSTIPCDDGGGVYVYARMSYRTPSAGSYRVRVSLYTSADGLLAHGPLHQWNNVGANNSLVYPAWSTSHGYTGNAEAVAHVFRWNGSGWALVAGDDPVHLSSAPTGGRPR